MVPASSLELASPLCMLWHAAAKAFAVSAPTSCSCCTHLPASSPVHSETQLSLTWFTPMVLGTGPSTGCPEMFK